MARKKTAVERKPPKIKKTRKLSEEHKDKLRDRLAKMRAKKKPAEYKNIAKSVLALPDNDTYSFKNVKEWIKENKLQISALGQQARSTSTESKEKRKASNLADSKKAYIRYCEHYLKHGDWIGIFSGASEEHKVVPRCVAIAYYPDGTPKRSVGVFYPDINAVWSKGMDESEFPHLRDDFYSSKDLGGRIAITDKQFTFDT
jgi:L-lactate utilization protein LutC